MAVDQAPSSAIVMGHQSVGGSSGEIAHAARWRIGSIASAPFKLLKKSYQTKVILGEMWRGAKAGARTITAELFDGRTTPGGMIDVVLKDLTRIDTFGLAFLRPIMVWEPS